MQHCVCNVFLQIKPEDSFWTIEDKKNIVVHLEKVSAFHIKINNAVFVGFLLILK